MDINITLFGQMITFAIFVWFTGEYVWPPIMAALDERQAKIAKGIADADKATEKLHQANEDASDIINQAKEEAKHIIAAAKMQGNDIITDKRKEAESIYKNKINSAEIEIKQNFNIAKDDLYKDVATLVTTATEKLLGNEVNQGSSNKIVDELLAEINE